MNRSSTIGGFLGFVALGVMLSSYGPSIPTLRTSFGLDAAAAGLILGANFGGAFSGMLVTAALTGRVGPRSRLAAATVLTGVSALLLGAAQSYPLVLLAAAGIGLGFGVLSVGYSLLFASGFGARSGAMLTLLNGSFGAGAVAAPVAIGLLPQHRYAPVFVIGAILLMATLPLALAAPTTSARTARTRARAGSRAIGPVAGFVGLMFLYDGIEQGVAGWATTHLLALGIPAALAAGTSGFFWAAMTIGRIAGAPLALRVREEHLVIGALVLVLPMMALASWPPSAVLAYTLTGLVLAPIFPTAVMWFARLAPDADAHIALLYAGAQLGAVALPVAIGQLIHLTRPQAVPAAIAGISFLCLATCVGLRQATRGRREASREEARTLS